MDMAKEALLKAEETESRLNALVSEMPSFGVCPSEGGTRAEYEGGAGVLIASVSSTGEGVVRVTLDGVTVGSVPAGSTGTLAFPVSGSGGVEAVADEGVTVTSFSVIALATGGATFSPVSVRVAAAEGETGTYAVVPGTETAVYDMFDPSAPLTTRWGGSADVAAGDGPVVAAAGECGLGLIDPTGSAGGRLLPAVKAVALDACDGGYVLATYDGSLVTISRLSPGLARVAPTRSHASAGVRSLAFVKGAYPPALIIEENGRTLLRRAEEEAFAFLPLTVTAGV